MSGKKTVGWRVDADVKERFEKFVVETHGKKRGKLGETLERAMKEYMDNDRASRLESGQEEIKEMLRDMQGDLRENENTHTHNDDASKQTGGVEQIETVISREHGGSIKDSMLDNVICDVRNLETGDPRTLENWKDKLKKNGILWRLPTDTSLYLTDAEEWATSLANNWEHKIPALCEEHYLSLDEFAELEPDEDDGDEDGEVLSENEGLNEAVDEEFDQLMSSTPVARADGGTDH